MTCFPSLALVCFALELILVGSAWSRPQVPCFFIFGDSLVDNGNNNDILTLSRANYMPYGIDFSRGITGRFTNGRTYVDVLAQLLGFRDFIPPFASTGGTAVLRGLNYASGAAGIRDESGIYLGDRFSMNRQIDNFRTTVGEIRRIFRGNISMVNAHLGRCIFYVGIGSNDYLNNYFMPTLYTTSSEYTPQTYASALLQDYSQQLTRLYELGARKVAVASLGQIGCIPYELARTGRRNRNGGSCNEEINSAVIHFNRGLRNLVVGANANRLFPGAKFVYIDSFHTSTELVRNARSYGFKVVDRGCCGVGRNNGQVTCLPLQTPCNDRSSYFYWDAFHPTEAANVIMARKAYSSNSRADVYPINIQRLAKA